MRVSGTERVACPVLLASEPELGQGVWSSKKQGRRVPGGSLLQTGQLWEKSLAYLPESWQENPSILGRGVGGVEGGRCCPPSSGSLARDPPQLPPDPHPLPRQNPPPPPPTLARLVGSAVPLKGPESELRRRLTQCGRGGP